VFSLSLSRGTAHATSECQTEVRENAVSKYHFPFGNCGECGCRTFVFIIYLFLF